MRLVTLWFIVLISTVAHAENGVTAGTILLGQSAGYTGAASGPVKEMSESAKAYFAYINKLGGVNGRAIELKSLDDALDAKRTSENVRRLIEEDRVFALFGIRGTPNAQAAVPYVQKHGVPMFAPSTGAQIFHEPFNPLIFNVRAKYQDEVIAIVEYLGRGSISSIGLVHDDSSFGRDGLDGFKRGMKELRLEPMFISAFNRDTGDISQVVAQTVKASPQALVMVGSPKPVAAFVKALKKTGSTTQVFTLSNVSSQSFIDDVGPEGHGVVVSQVSPYPFSPSVPLSREYQRLAKEAGVAVSYAGMEGYIAAKVLVEGLRRAGRELTRERFIRAMETIKDYDLGDLLITFGPRDRSGSEFVELTMVGRNGKFVR